ASLRTIAGRSSGRTSFSCPPLLPIGVGAVATITASGIYLLFGCAPREEAGNAFRELGACRLRFLQVGLELERLLKCRVEGVVDRALCCRESPARLTRQVRGQLAHHLIQLLGGHHSVDHAQPLSIN